MDAVTTLLETLKDLEWAGRHLFNARCPSCEEDIPYKGPARHLDDCDLAAPTLLRYEIGSVCLKKLATYPHKQRPLLEALALYPRMNLREFEVPIPESVALARRERLTAYDAAYLWLAQELDVELVTFDDTLRRASH